MYIHYFCAIYFGFMTTLLVGILMTAPKFLLYLTAVGASPDLVQLVSGLAWAIAGILGWNIFTSNKPDADELALYEQSESAN